MGGLGNRQVAEIYRAYGDLVLRRCRAILRDPALADDALQEVFVKVVRYGAELEGASSKLAWLYRVADRCCFDLMDRQRRTPTSGTEAVDYEPSWHPVHHAEARDGVLRVLQDLNERERRVAVLAFLDGASQGEIADEVGWSRQTVNRKVQEIRDRAMRLLQRRAP